MDERQLKELELLLVAQQYDLVDRLRLRTPQAGPDSSSAPAAPPAPMPADSPRTSRQAPPVQSPVRATDSPPGDVAAMGWEELRARVRECTNCELCKQRKQAVFGVGSETGPWLFVGEGPGADEDEQGEPFVGQAGKLLDQMLAATGLKRGKDVYIANVVKCRPPGNRTPKPEEAAACAPYLDRQIDLIQPKVIVALGKTAAVRLLGQVAAESSLGSLRGRAHRYREWPLVVTYHPAYLLRNLPDKSKAWEDLLFARKTLAAAIT